MFLCTLCSNHYIQFTYLVKVCDRDSYVEEAISDDNSNIEVSDEVYSPCAGFIDSNEVVGAYFFFHRSYFSIIDLENYDF